MNKIESLDFLTEKETFYQLRLEAIELVNQVNAGLRTYTEGNIRGLKFINSNCAEYGFGPIDFGNAIQINVAKMGYISE